MTIISRILEVLVACINGIQFYCSVALIYLYIALRG